MPTGLCQMKRCCHPCISVNRRPHPREGLRAHCKHQKHPTPCEQSLPVLNKACQIALLQLDLNGLGFPFVGVFELRQGALVPLRGQVPRLTALVTATSIPQRLTELVGVGRRVTELTRKLAIRQVDTGRASNPARCSTSACGGKVVLASALGAKVPRVGMVLTVRDRRFGVERLPTGSAVGCVG
jgi:hypothetical protein